MSCTFSPEQIAYLNTSGITQFSIHDNRVYELKYLISGKAPTDRLIDMLANLVKGENAQSPTIRVLIDWSQGSPSISYLFSRIRKLMKDEPERAPVRFAVLLKGENVPVAIIDTLIHALRIESLEVRLAPPSQRASAWDWLVQNVKRRG